MKFIHLSDLHIGKRVNGYSMLDDQDDILDKILTIIDSEQPDAVLIAGDIYDKSVPSTEAVSLLNRFLVRLSRRDTEVFIISGNHDSAERLGFCSSLIDGSGIHFSPAYSGDIQPHILTDEYGEVRIFMLPFLKPAHVRPYFPGEAIDSYTDAMRAVIGKMELGERNILVAHQFVTGSVTSDSEELSVGGTDNVDAAVFEPFDYTALGHIHRPQNCGSERVRYSGTPLKYSFSESNDRKSVTVGELAGDGGLTLRTIPLKPLHDMIELKGKYEALAARDFYENTGYQEDYTHITLTDEEDIPDAVNKLRVIYHNLMKLDYDNTRTRTGATVTAAESVETKSPLTLFSELYEKQNNQPLDNEQTTYLQSLIEELWEVDA